MCVNVKLSFKKSLQSLERNLSNYKRQGLHARAARWRVVLTIVFVRRLPFTGSYVPDALRPAATSGC